MPLFEFLNFKENVVYSSTEAFARVYPSDSDSVVLAYFIFQMITNLSFAALALFAFTPLITALDESIKTFQEKSTNLKMVRWRLSTVRRETIVQTTFSAATFLLFAVWPYLRRKVVYQIPIQALLWMALTIGISAALFSTGQTETTATSQENNNPQPGMNKILINETSNKNDFKRVIDGQTLANASVEE